MKDTSDRSFNWNEGITTGKNTSSNHASSSGRGFVSVSKKTEAIVSANKPFDETISRIYLLRHYPYDDSNPTKKADIKEYERCLKNRGNLKGTDEEKANLKRILDLWKKVSVYDDLSLLEDRNQDLFRNALIDPEQTVLIYNDNPSSRAGITWEDLHRKYPNIPVRKVNLPGSLKDDDMGENDQKMIQQLTDAFNTAIYGCLWLYKTIIVIGNRSYSHGFDVLTSEWREHGQTKSEEIFEEDHFLLVDYTLNTELRRSIIRSRNDQIEVNLKNYREMVSFAELFLPEEIRLPLSPQELQNTINSLFFSRPDLFRKVLINKESPTDLIAFCLANTLKNPREWDSQHLKEFSKNLFWHGGIVNAKLLDAIFRFWRPNFIRETCTDLVLANEENLEMIRSVAKAFGQDTILPAIESAVEVIQASGGRAWEAFALSIDKTIQEKKTESLLARDLYFARERTPSEIEALKQKRMRAGMEKDGSVYVDPIEKTPASLNTILNSNGNLPTTLVGHVGEGKSTELSRIYQTIKNGDEYHEIVPLFFSARTILALLPEKSGDTRTSGERIVDAMKESINSVSGIFPEKRIVLFFDGIDELSSDIKKSIVSFLLGLSKTETGSVEYLPGTTIPRVQVIMGARPSEFGTSGNETMRVLRFESISTDDRENFLKDRLLNVFKIPASEIDERLAAIHAFLAGGILEESLKNTPLILFFLARITGESDGLEKIWSRADLYEIMAEKILFEHQGIKEYPEQKANGLWRAQNGLGSRSSEKTMLFDILGQCAFQRFRDPTSPINREFIQNILIQNYRYSKDNTSELESICNQIFLLYRLEGNDQYTFILKSFEEYFLARHLTGLSNQGNEMIYQFRDEAMLNDETVVDGKKKRNWGDWRNFRPVVMFYGQILGNKITECMTREEALQKKGTPANSREYHEIARKKEELLGQLVSFLGEDGILKNDDIFGENFFMGLEILLGLPESIQSRSDISDILNEFLTKIDGKDSMGNAVEGKGWNEKTTILQFENLVKVLSICGNKVRSGAIKRMEVVVEELVSDSGKMYDDIYLKYPYSQTIEYAKTRLDDSKKAKDWERYFDLCHKILIHLKGEEAVNLAKEGLGVLRGAKEWLRYFNLCAKMLNRLEWEEAMRLAREGLGVLRGEGEWGWYSNLCKEMLNHLKWDEAMKLAREGLGVLRETKEWRGYSDLCAKMLNHLGWEEVMKLGKEGLGVLRETKEWWRYSNLCSEILNRLGWKEVMNLAKESLSMLREAKEWSGYSNLCAKMLNRLEWEEAMRLAREGLGVLRGEGEWGWYSNLCKEMLNHLKWDEAMKLAREGLGVLREEREWLQYSILYWRILIQLKWDEAMKLAREGLGVLREERVWGWYSSLCRGMLYHLGWKEAMILVRESLGVLREEREWGWYSDLCREILNRLGWEEAMMLVRESLGVLREEREWEVYTALRKSLSEISNPKILEIFLSESWRISTNRIFHDGFSPDNLRSHPYYFSPNLLKSLPLFSYRWLLSKHL